MAKDAIFPTNLCFWFGAADEDIYETIETRSLNGVRTSSLKYHTKEFTLPIGHLNNDEALLLKGFINYVMGRHHSFYLVDPFHPVENMTFTGDGGTTDFQLYRDYVGLYREYPVFPSGIIMGYGIDGWICAELNGYGVPIQYDFEVYVDGILQTSGYALSSDGKIEFTYPPADGAVILIPSWKFCYEAHFKDNPKRSLYIYRGWKTDLVIETEEIIEVAPA